MDRHSRSLHRNAGRFDLSSRQGRYPSRLASRRYKDRPKGILLLFSGCNLYSTEHLSDYYRCYRFTTVEGATLTRSSIELSLVIPAFNEEECIEECVREADAVMTALGRPIGCEPVVFPSLN